MSWLEDKIRFLKKFDGSLLEYVGSGRVVKDVEGGVLKLDSNENFFVSSEFLKGLLLQAVGDVDLRFYNPEAIADVREALGKYLGVSSDRIIVGSGSEQLIDLLACLFLDAGDNVISIVPSFFAYEKRISLRGAKFFGVPLMRDLSLDVNGVLERVDSGTRLVFVCSPNNPTGNQFSLEEVRALAECVSAVVVLDEAYAEFGDYSAVSLVDDLRNVVVLRTFSKAFGVAGLRFGYAVAHRDLASTLSNIIPYTVSNLVARFIVRLLGSVEYIQKCVEGVKKERGRLLEGLRFVEGLEVFDSKANFVTFRPFKDADFVYEKLLERRILVKNLSCLPVIGNCLRVTVGLTNMNEQFLRAISEIMSRTD